MGPSHVHTPQFGLKKLLIQFSETWQYFYWSSGCYCSDWFCTVTTRSLPALNGLIGSCTDLITLTGSGTVLTDSFTGHTGSITALTGSFTALNGLIGSGTDLITLTDSPTAAVVLILLCLV